jgi:hypothetical protein
MKTYIIKTSHEIEIDTYKDGLTNYANSYSLKSEIKAATPREAVQKYFDEYLYYNFDIKSAYILHEEEENEATNVLFYDVLVDEENNEATEKQRELWKKDKLTLYNNRIYLEIFLTQLTTI